MPRESAESPSVPVDLPPKKRLAAAVERYGEPSVVERSLSLLAGNNEGEDFLLYVGGDHAQGILDGAPVLYWPELWGARALLYVWNDSAAPAIIDAMNNPAWRVREMSARVVAARELSAASELSALLTDKVPRVRVAAAKALAAVGTLEDMDGIRILLKDPEIDVRRGAQQALDALRKRFPKS
ncbi:HEAT repeat domain-containing protein [Microbacterium esteraromaticum]|uniref:HEAT repeat domain-containing protein n=1 Tax=Microbacterium esteraromaticum TaxID=57043 RepID=UPI00211B1FA1|nr:HEAT repeat domain-containing protein [Microbacterium esteraromaticum]